MGKNKLEEHREDQRRLEQGEQVEVK